MENKENVGPSNIIQTVISIVSNGCIDRQNPRHVNEMYNYIPLVGVAYRTEEEQRVFKNIQTFPASVDLFHEPTLHDAYAVKVVYNGCHIGYVHPDFSEQLHNPRGSIKAAHLYPYRSILVIIEQK